MLRRILRRMYKSPEEDIIRKVLEHASKCREATQYLANILELAVKGHDMEEEIARVEQAEREADKLRRDILDQLAEGALPPISREDFVRLVERVDMIADWSRDACRVLKALNDTSCIVKIEKPLIRLASCTKEVAEKLLEALKAFKTNFSKARKLIEEVERIEDEGDKAYTDCLHMISKRWSEINDPLVLTLVESLENLIDAAEDASDVLEEIIVRVLR